MNWERHIDELLIRLSSACYVIRKMKPIMTNYYLQNYL
jgi:hypothetical protein